MVEQMQLLHRYWRPEQIEAQRLGLDTDEQLLQRLHSYLCLLIRNGQTVPAEIPRVTVSGPQVYRSAKSRIAENEAKIKAQAAAAAAAQRPREKQPPPGVAKHPPVFASGA